MEEATFKSDLYLVPNTRKLLLHRLLLPLFCVGSGVLGRLLQLVNCYWPRFPLIVAASSSKTRQTKAELKEHSREKQSRDFCLPPRDRFSNHQSRFVISDFLLVMLSTSEILNFRPQVTRGPLFTNPFELWVLYSPLA